MTSLPGTKPNEIDIKFVANRTNQADQILVLLLGAVLIALLVNKPGNLRIRPELGCAIVQCANAPPAQSSPTNDRAEQPCIFPIDTSTAHQPGVCIHPRQAARPADRARPSTNSMRVRDVSLFPARKTIYARCEIPQVVERDRRAPPSLRGRPPAGAGSYQSASTSPRTRSSHVWRFRISANLSPRTSASAGSGREL